MKNRPDRRRVRSGEFMNSLETRNLPSAGMAGLADVLRELGPVSRSAATSGVEAVASIDSGTSVTFRFEIEAAGNYTLLVRHIGDGLTIEAKGPTGSAAINPGSAGPFQVVPLNFKEATYEVTASARGGQPVFIDWELLLNTGVGQSVAAAPGAVLPALAVPVSAPAPASAPSGEATAAAPAHSDASTSLPASSSSSAQAATWSSSGELVGRFNAEPSSSINLADRFTNPAGPPSARELSPLDITLINALQPAIQDQPGAEVAKAEAPWWSRMFDPTLPEPVSDPIDDRSLSGSSQSSTLAQLTADLTSSDSPKTRVSLASISPGLLFGGIAVTVASRSRLKGIHQYFRQSSDTSPRETMRMILEQMN